MPFFSTPAAAIFAASRCAALTLALVALGCAPVDGRRPREDAATAAHQLKEANLAPPSRTILMVPPTSGTPSGGGENNFAFFAFGLQNLGFDVHVLMRPTTWAQIYRREGIKTMTPPDVWVPQEAYHEAITLADDLLATVQTVTLRLNDGERPERLADMSERIMSIMAALELLAFPNMRVERAGTQRAIEGPWGSGPALAREALQVRWLARQTDADLCLADRRRHALATTVGLLGMACKPVWYTQLDAPTEVDKFVSTYGSVITFGDGVRRMRFDGVPGVQAVAGGINPKRFVPRRKKQRRHEVFAAAGPDDLLIGNVAHVTPRRNQLAIVQAVAMRAADLGNFQLYFFGSEGAQEPHSYYGQIMQHARAAGIAERVHFMGDQSRVEDLMPHLDIFVLSSLVAGMPLSLMEAMSCGVAALASDIPTCQEFAGHGVSLFDPQVPAQLADALVGLAQAPAQRAQQGNAARQRILQGGYTSKHMLQSMAWALTNVKG